MLPTKENKHAASANSPPSTPFTLQLPQLDTDHHFVSFIHTAASIKLQFFLKTPIA
jgi:hypothetical protein